MERRTNSVHDLSGIECASNLPSSCKMLFVRLPASEEGEREREDPDMDDDLLPGFAQDHARRPPREVVHLPEGVQGEEEGEYGDGENVEKHPPKHVPPSAEEEDECLETVYGSDHDEGGGRDSLPLADHQIDEIADLERVEWLRGVFVISGERVHT